MVTEECVHHWMIDSPSGKKSKGTCKHCGTTRMFLNSYEYSSWYGFNKTRRPANWKPSKNNKGRFAPGKGKLS